jgi:hypothetical protein
MKIRLGAVPAALLVAAVLVQPSAAMAEGIPTYGCHGVEEAVSAIGPQRAAKAFACWVDGVRRQELGHVTRLRLESHLNRAAARTLASGHFGLSAVKRTVRRAGYLPHRRPGHRTRWRVARAAPVLLSDGVTPLLIGDDVLWHDPKVFAPPYRDIGIAIKGGVFFAITAFRSR